MARPYKGNPFLPPFFPFRLPGESSALPKLSFALPEK